MTYDYNGEKYNCFRAWGDEKYKISKDKLCNELVDTINNKSKNKYCDKCWARNLCKICILAVHQGVDEVEISENCREATTYEMCLQEIIKVIDENRLDTLIKNFTENFLEYI